MTETHILVESVPPSLAAGPLIGAKRLLQTAIDKAGKADREAVGEVLRTADFGPSRHYPAGELKFNSKGQRLDAGMVSSVAKCSPGDGLPRQSGACQTALAERVIILKASGANAGSFHPRYGETGRVRQRRQSKSTARKG